MAVAGTLDDFAAETLDLFGRHLVEAGIQRVAGFELFAVDQEGAGATERIAVPVEIAEERESAMLERDRAVFVLAMKP